MADKQQIFTDRRPPGKTLLLASIAGLIVGGPLICLMGISFAATVTLLLVSSPLFLIFSPVLFAAVCLFGFVMLGFAVAAATAVAGLASVAWLLRSFAGRRSGQVYGGGVSDKMMESGGGGYNIIPRDNVLIIQ